jgi:hypothetical protein
MAQYGPKMAPIWSQYGPNMAHDDPIWFQDGPKINVREGAISRGGLGHLFSTSRCPQYCPRWLGMAARWPLYGLGWPNMTPRWFEIRHPRGGYFSRGSWTLMFGPKAVPRWPQDGPRWPHDGPIWPNMLNIWTIVVLLAPRWPQDPSKMAPRPPNMAPRPHKIAQDGPKMAQHNIALIEPMVARW